MMIMLKDALYITIIMMLFYTSHSLTIDRRSLIKKGSTSIVGAFPLFGSSALSTAPDKGITVLNFEVFRVNPDSSASLNPTLTSVSKDTLLKSISSATIKTNKGGTIWLGEHHNSIEDHMLQAQMIRDIYSLRRKGSRRMPPPPMAIGLEQVQIKFQHILDDYVDGKITTDEMKDLVEWESRWQWPFEGYRPAFEAAKELGIKIIALNVNSEDLANVEQSGLPGLSPAKLQQYISDP